MRHQTKKEKQNNSPKKILEEELDERHYYDYWEDYWNDDYSDYYPAPWLKGDSWQIVWADRYQTPHPTLKENKKRSIRGWIDFCKRVKQGRREVLSKKLDEFYYE